MLCFLVKLLLRFLKLVLLLDFFLGGNISLKNLFFKIYDCGMRYRVGFFFFLWWFLL